MKEETIRKAFFTPTEEALCANRTCVQEQITLLNKKYSLIGNTKIQPEHFQKFWDAFPLAKNNADKEVCYQRWVELCERDYSLSLEAFQNVLQELNILWEVRSEKAELVFRGITDIKSFLRFPYYPTILKKINGKNSFNTYQEQLQHPLWQKKRLEIMQRDNFGCQNCGDNQTTLNVHHKKYLQGKMPWEYPDEDLITLCETCHSIVELNKKK